MSTLSWAARPFPAHTTDSHDRPPGRPLTYAFPVWNLGPSNANHEVLNTQVPAGTTFDYIRISGTPGLGTCTTPPYQGTGEDRLSRKQRHGSEHHVDGAVDVKVTARGTVITDEMRTDDTLIRLANNTRRADHGATLAYRTNADVRRPFPRGKPNACAPPLLTV